MQTLFNELKRAVQRENASMHMPGHKYKALQDENWYAVDTTEIAGTDNLFAAQGIIAQSMADIAEIYGVQASRLLVNGSTVGLLAAILANTAPGDGIIIPRDAHKAVFNACQLGALKYHTVMPQMAESGRLLGYVGADYLSCLEDNPAIKVVVITSPTYYGFITDVSPIVEKLALRGGVLIVDEAHGAHLNFCQNGGSAIAGGAHIVVQSAHKMLAALTQTALLHYNNVSDDVIKNVDRYLAMLQSSSPSYVLMSSIDLAVKDMFARRAEHLSFESELRQITGERLADWLAPQQPQDPFKLWLETVHCGYSGFDFESILEEAGLYAELATEWGVLLYLGHYNTTEDLLKIVEVLENVAKRAAYQPTPIQFSQADERIDDLQNREIVSVALKDAVGHYVAEDIIPYPPGIRLLMQGEKMTPKQAEIIQKMRDSGHTIMGTADTKVQCIQIYKEQ